jgi:putative transposase
MISEPDRRQTIELIETSCRDGARLIPACQVLKISARTYQRWTKTESVAKDRRPDAIRPTPANKLTTEERQHVLEVCHQKENASLPPSQIVPKLADQGPVYCL